VDFDFRVRRVEQSENIVGCIHVRMKYYPYGGYIHATECEVDAYPLHANSSVDLVRWASEQLAQQAYGVSQYAIFEAMCRNRDIQREFRLPQPDSLSTRYDVQTNRFYIRLRLTDGRSLQTSLDCEMTGMARPEEINRQLSLDLAHQCGIDAHVLYEALERLVRWNPRFSVDYPATWRYDDREPVRWAHNDLSRRREYEGEWTEQQVRFRPVEFSITDRPIDVTAFGDAFQTYITEQTARAFGVDPELVTPDPNKKEADERAKQLLLDHLSEEQKKTFEKDGWFECVGNKTKKVYRIHNYRNINTLQGKTKYCLVQKSTVPLPDQLLTEKMLIENDEDKFLKVANRFDSEPTTITGDLSRGTIQWG
jgi:hypothetical protein